jgi:transcription antitermination factor NusG
MHSKGILERLSVKGNEAWYALYAKHQHEKSAANLLSRKGFDVLLPLYRVAHRWKDRSKVVELPVFPCYLFLRANLEYKTEILRTPGVFWFVGTGGRAHPVAEHEIDAVRRVAQGPARFEPHPYLHSGDRVRIRSGALVGIEGFLIRFKNQYRIVLSVELLQKSVAVEVDVSSVQRIVQSSASSALAYAPMG